MIARARSFAARLAQAPLTAKIGVAILAINLFVALFAPLLAPYGQTQIVGGVWEQPIWSQLSSSGDVMTILGTDHLGRDLLSRLIYGARNTISIAALTTLIAFLLGVTGGLASATMRGWVDQLLSRGVDVLMSFPTLIFALLVLSIVGTSVPAMIGVIAVLEATRVYRVTRAVAMDVEVQEYVDVAKIRGEGSLWIMRHEILPNAAAPLLAEFGLRFCYVFLFISSLSFLGLGIQPPTADWGSMLRENAPAISFGMLTPLFPALSVVSLTVAVNLVVDWFLSSTGRRLSAGTRTA